MSEFKEMCINDSQSNNDEAPKTKQKTKTVKKNKSIQKPKKNKQSLQVQLLHPNFQEQVIAIQYNTPVGEYKFFIRGDLLIDLNYLRQNSENQQNFFSLNDFRPAKSVQFSKKNNFYQILFENGKQSLQDFNFVIDMLNSVGDQNIHKLAIELEKYQQALSILDKQKHERILQQNSDNNIYLQSENHGWSYEMSLDKAHILLNEKLSKKEGHIDYSELSVYGINDNSLKLILGNIDHDSTVKILLQNGLILMNQNFMDVVQNKLQETLINLDQQSGMEPEYMTFNQQVSNVTINNHLLDLNFTYEKYRLSNYNDRFNDNLILARIDDKEKLKLMNQLFVQKLLSDFSMNEEKVLLSDITYSAQSEYFIDKFYTKDFQQ